MLFKAENWLMQSCEGANVITRLLFLTHFNQALLHFIEKPVIRFALQSFDLQGYSSLPIVPDDLEFHHIVTQKPDMKNVLFHFCHSATAPLPHFNFEANFTGDNEHFQPSSLPISDQCSYFASLWKLKKTSEN